ncbi:SWI/SNF chromatin-remodeling complex subunit SNF5-like [Zingiber officinale]|uniref:SWI/SNF chromatin-remodeling complex subunit SNF5-like n=1 Tax=Zingiber officinale TaxID=94328 RepID=UPI001C4CC112|nr:SWI/SNF chromatin-remodeling complex subunit SNF5-like [Zingiber officinale]
MAESNNNNNNSMAQQQQQQHQQLLMQQHQQQLFLMQQQQHQHQQQQFHLQQQQQLQQLQRQQQQQKQQSGQHQSPYSLLQQQQAISRFPSNIDAHLRAPGLRSLHFQGPAPPPSSSQPPSATNLHHHPPQAQPARPSGVGVGIGRPGNPLEVEMAQKDAMMVCNPDFKRPFASVEDAVLRLLPYHVVSDYEAEEDDRILDSDTTGQIYSRIQQWDNNILAKIAEFTTTFEKQVLAFNIMTRKRAQGEFRSEERLMIEQALLQEEKQALLGIRAEIESREKAGREAAEAKMRMAMAQAEHARAEAQAHAEMYARAPMRASAAGLTESGSGHDIVPEQGGNMDEIHGWGNAQREDEEPSEDFLNDENEPENGDTDAQGEWREAGELDLNSR